MSNIQDGYASILALHLLDSLSLPEALHVLLEQRTEALKHLESKSPEPRHPAQGNLELLSDKKPLMQPATTVWAMLEAALDVTSRTLCIVRDIFCDADGKPTPMMGRTLSFPESIFPSDPNLSIGSTLSTQKLLSGVPLSSRFSLHPSDIKLYKAFVDDTLSSFSLPPTTLSDTLYSWFVTATSHIEAYVRKWFDELPTLKDVSQVHSLVNKWFSTQKDLQAREAADLMSVIKGIYRFRVQVLWKRALHDIKLTFDSELSTFVSQEHGPSVVATQCRESQESDLPAILSVPPLPRVEWTGHYLSLSPSSFTTFRSAIRQRVDGKIAHVAGLLSAVEDETRQLQQDLQLATDCHDENK